MNKKYLYLGAAALAGAVVAYFCTMRAADAAASAVPDFSALGQTGVVTGGDPTIVAGTFGYALPAPVKTYRY